MSLRKSLPIHSLHSLYNYFACTYKKLAAHMLTCSFVAFVRSCTARVGNSQCENENRSKKKSCSDNFLFLFHGFRVCCSWMKKKKQTIYLSKLGWLLQLYIKQVKLSLFKRQQARSCFCICLSLLFTCLWFMSSAILFVIFCSKKFGS